MKVKLHSEKGASAVEFAIVLPLLFVITFGIIELGLILYNKAVITNASREGARGGVVARYNASGDYSPLSDDDITAVVTSYCAAYLVGFPKGTPVTAITPDYSVRATNNQPQTPVNLTVDVTYDYSFLVLPNLPFIPVPPFTTLGWFPNPYHLRAVTVMRME